MVLQIKILIFLCILLGIGFVALKKLLTTEAWAMISGRITAGVFLASILGLFAPNIYILYFGLFFIVAMLPRTPVEAVGMAIICYFMLPTLGMFQTLPNGTYFLPLDTRLFIGAGLIPQAFRARLLTRRDGVIITVLMVSLYLMSFSIDLRVSAITATAIFRTSFIQFMSLLLPYLVITRIVRSEAQLRQVMLFFAVVGLLLSIIACFEMFRHWALYDAMSSHFGQLSLSKATNMRAGLLRSSGPFINSTMFGLFLAVAGTMVFMMRSSFKSASAHRLAITLISVGIFATLTRNGWVGALVGFLAASSYRGQAGKFVAVTFGAALAIFMAAAILPASDFLGSVLGESGHAASTGAYRQTLFTEGMVLVRQHPFTGLPVDQVTAALTTKLRSGSLEVDFVNTYLYFAMTTGVFGFLIFLSLFLVPLNKLWSMRRRVMPGFKDRELFAAIFGSLAALAVMMVFTSFFDRVPIITVFLLAFARSAFALASRQNVQKQQPAVPYAQPFIERASLS